MTSVICGKCKNFLTYMDEDIFCDGFCNHRFHISCAKISNYSKEINFIQKNVKWFCDCCCDILKDFKQNYELELSFKTIKISKG